jgi:hypothetical protein
MFPLLNSAIVFRSVARGVRPLKEVLPMRVQLLFGLLLVSCLQVSCAGTYLVSQETRHSDCTSRYGSLINVKYRDLLYRASPVNQSIEASVNGEEWFTSLALPAGSPNCVASTSTCVAATSDSPNRLQVSSDGKNWSSFALPTTCCKDGAFNKLAPGDNMIYVFNRLDVISYDGGSEPKLLYHSNDSEISGFAPVADGIFLATEKKAFFTRNPDLTDLRETTSLPGGITIVKLFGSAKYGEVEVLYGHFKSQYRESYLCSRHNSSSWELLDSLRGERIGAVISGANGLIALTDERVMSSTNGTSWSTVCKNSVEVKRHWENRGGGGWPWPFGGPF